MIEVQGSVFECFSKVQFLESLGNIYKVRLGFEDETQDEQNWQLDKVRLGILSIDPQIMLFCAVLMAQFILGLDFQPVPSYVYRIFQVTVMIIWIAEVVLRFQTWIRSSNQDQNI